MTEFTPLAEAASASALLFFLGLPTAWRANGFKQELRRQSHKLAAVLAHMVAVPVGLMLGIGAWVARPTLGAAYVFTELWNARAAQVIWSLWQSLGDYCAKRRFYRAQHAA